MGRRSINTTKSGKFMNPTDQARKEARKRELKKNKKQRMMVRQAVLKGKDPLKLLQEMEMIDKMEYNPLETPKLNEKVLKDKRKKLKETFQRVLRLYEKENLDFAKDLKKAEVDYEKKRFQLQIYFEQVKNAERVQLDQIPLPDIPIHMTIPSMIPLPNEIPLPSMLFIKQPASILKKSSVYDLRDVTMMKLADIKSGRKGKPAGPPPGPPALLSDSEDEEYDPAKDIEENLGNVEIDVEHPTHDSDDELPPLPDPDEPPVKQRKIRFADDEEFDSDEEEKDTRLHVSAKPNKSVTPLQEKMLRLAGQAAPVNEENREQESSDDEDLRDSRREGKSMRDTEKEDKEDEKDKKTEPKAVSEEPHSQPPRLVPPGPPPGAPPGAPSGVPPGAPPGLPSGLPPGPPPVAMFRPPPLRGGPPGAPPRLLPPGPPPGRPHGLPPGPPPGLPPNIRLPPRLPPGPPGVLPPRMLRPPGMPPGVHLPGLPHPPGMGGALQNPNILSAPPSIMKPPLKASDDDKKRTATIEAKPQIKHVMGDVTRFTPTALKVKRETKDSKGRIKQPAKEEEKKFIGLAPKAIPAVPIQTKTRDDVYDQFMKEMENLL